MNNIHSLRSNTKGYGGKTHYTESHISYTTATIGKELYHHLQFSLQAANPETFGYTLVFMRNSWFSRRRIEVVVFWVGALCNYVVWNQRFGGHADQKNRISVLVPENFELCIKNFFA
jgi:hypothetical protein